MYNLDRIIKRLKIAIRRKSDIKLLITTKEWFSEEKNVLMPYYTIYQYHYDPKTKKKSQEELFKCGSKIQVVLFLRDYWYTLNGWEIPQDDYWDKKKERYRVKYDRTGKEKAERSQEDTSDSSGRKVFS